jgi:hypothetical protein
MSFTYSGRVALLANTIDFAGTFPPASLSLDESLRVAARFRRVANHPWLFGKVVVTLPQLKSLSAKDFYLAGADGALWEFTALGTPEENPDAFFATLRSELSYLSEFNSSCGFSVCRRLVTSYENKLPEALISAPKNQIVAFGEKFLRSFSFPGGHAPIYPYLEIPFRGDWREVTSWLGEVFSQSSTIKPGVKIRTGGAYVPSLTELAEVIAAVSNFKLKFKATQGLHHAVTGTGGFGFVNLFAAVNLRAIFGAAFGPAEIVRCLGDDDGKHFSFSSESFTWEKFTATLTQLELARLIHSACFGSCSLQEPDLFLGQEIPEIGQENSK